MIICLDCFGAGVFVALAALAHSEPDQSPNLTMDMRQLVWKMLALCSQRSTLDCGESLGRPRHSAPLIND